MDHEQAIKKLKGSTRWADAVQEMSEIDPDGYMGGHEEQDCAFSLMQDVLDPSDELRGDYDLCFEVIDALRAAEKGDNQ